MTSCRNVRMAPGCHVRIDANRNRWMLAAETYVPFGFCEQDFQLRFRFHVEEKDAAVRTLRGAPIGSSRVVQGFADFLARLPHAGKHDPIAAHAEMAQMFQLAARNNIESAPALVQIIQEGEIAIRFHGKTNRVRSFSEPLIEFYVCLADRRSAIAIRWSAEGLCRADKIDALAKNMFNILIPRGFFPGELRREFRRVHVRQLLRRPAPSRAHRTFNTTSVRSPAGGAPCANQSASRITRSASSLALDSWCFSISERSLSVPKYWPSLLLVSAMPSE